MKIECHDPKRSLHVATAFRSAAFQAAAEGPAKGTADSSEAAGRSEALRPGRPWSVGCQTIAPACLSGIRSRARPETDLKRHESHPSRNL